jgi:4-aminobutyrate aminotransferase
LPLAALAKEVQQCAAAAGLIVLTCGVSNKVVRFLFPLTIPDALFDEGTGIFCTAVHKATTLPYHRTGMAG